MKIIIPRVVSLNVGHVMPLSIGRRTVLTGFFKRPVSGPMRAEREGFVDDEQADHRIHGGALKAIYAYTSEDLAWWSQELGRELAPGLFGENITTEGLDLGAAGVGDRWNVGSAELLVTQPRVPCYKFAARMEDPYFPRRFAKALRTGLYLAVPVPGEITAGDVITVTPQMRASSILHIAREILHVTDSTL